ncbi:MAG: hypothetical protein MUQ10_12100 [Anaerolineae bacterium]|nr:hypothetical protein [Anaerolineae bacterium]
MRLILLLVLPVLVLFGLALVLMWAPLPRPFPPALSSARNLMAAIAVGVLGMITLAGVVVVTVGQVWRAVRSLDEVLAAHGLAPASGLLLGRGYAGTLQGRPVRASWVPGYGVRPGQLLVTVDADVGLIAAIADHRPLRPSADAIQVEMVLVDTWAPVVLAEADQAARLTDLLADPAVASALFQLLARSEPGGVREISLGSDGIHFRARPSTDVVGRQIERWLAAMLIFAERLESTEASR